MKQLSVLLYLDESALSRCAVQFLAPLAAAGAAQITLLASEADPARARALCEEAEAILQPPTRLEHRITRTQAELAITIEARARHSELVVMAMPGNRGWGRRLSAPYARALAHRLGSSLLIVQGQPVALNSALLLSGGGIQVTESARLVGRLLAPLHGQVTILHVVPQMPGPLNGPPTHERIKAHFMASDLEARRNLEEAHALLLRAGVEATVRIRVGAVREEAVAEMHECNYSLLVVRTRQTDSPVERLLLQDLTVDLMMTSAAPVLIVRGVS